MKHVLKQLLGCMFCEMGKGGGAPKPAAKPVRVDYKADPSKEAAKKKKKRPLGAQHLQTRKATPMGGGGFGGTAQTLG